jgi:predicted nucleic acid-binding protein
VVFVDTSVWVSYLRSGEPSVVAELDGLLEDRRLALAAPVRLELLSGAAKASVHQLARLLGALPTFHPSPDTVALAEGWVEKAGRAGHRFGAVDLLIGAIAAERGGQVWSLDADFQRLERLGLVKRHRPARA